MIYLDSAATSLLKPPSVARATAKAESTMASPGRGGHRAAMSCFMFRSRSVSCSP